MSLHGNAQIETTVQEEEGSFIAKTSNGGVTYGSRPIKLENFKTAAVTQEDENRAQKLSLLASSDKDTIEVQQKKLLLAKQELEDLKEKFKVLKRNYDSLSMFHAKDNAEFQRLKGQKDEYERKIDELQKLKLVAEDAVQRIRLETLQFERKVKELEKEVEVRDTEISNLKKEVAKREKLLEERLKIANIGLQSMETTKSKLEKQVADLKE